MRFKHQTGFTLMEVLVVLAIMTMLAPLAYPELREKVLQSRGDMSIAETMIIANAATAYRQDTGDWPGGVGCATAVATLLGAPTPYISDVDATNIFNNAIQTSCTTNLFQITQQTTANLAPYIAQGLPASSITDAATGTVQTSIAKPGTEPALDALLPRDGSRPMVDGAKIWWSSGAEIQQIGNTLALTGPDEVVLNGDVSVSQDLEVLNGTITAQDGLITSTQIDGSLDALLSRAVYDVRINQSGDIVTKPTCPAGATAQIFVAAASAPTGEAMLVTNSSGASVPGDIKRFRANADSFATTWQVWVEVFISGSWVRLAASEGDVRSTIKCT